jgi:hypothetical protein
MAKNSMTLHTSVKVMTVLRGWDMRARHKARHQWMKRLRAGQCVVLFNGALTIARIIDAAGGVHDYYTAEREKFDEGSLYNMVERGLHLSLAVGKSEVLVAPPPMAQIPAKVGT